MTDAIGIMEGAFFVPRGELLAWLAKDFKLNLAKVEQCASGAVYIQIADKIFYGKVPMSKVRWDAKLEYQYIINYKLLQQVFSKMEVTKFIDVDKLIKGKYQDNLEFLQWMKAFYDRMCPPNADYDPVERRLLANCTLPDWAKPPESVRATGGNSAVRSEARSLSSTGGTGPRTLRKPLTTTSDQTQQQNELKELKEEVAALKDEIETAEKERDFYFGKLRQIEVLCQEEGKKSLSTDEVQTILYAEESDENETENERAESIEAN